jgi:hypothetical protein
MGTRHLHWILTGPSFAVWPKKIYRLKEDQAFSLSLELDRREKLRGIRLQISSFTT